MNDRKKIISTLDIETLDGLKGSEFGVGGFYTYLNHKTRIDREPDFYIVKRNVKIFFKEIFEFSKSSTKKVLCYIQNEDFDARFILDYCINVLDIHPHISKSGSKILEIRIPELNITFRDIFQFILCSQAKAEKIFLKEPIKIEVNFEKIQRMLKSKNIKIVNKAHKILKERVISDIKGLYMVIDKFSSIIKKDYGVNFFKFVTLPSLSLDIYKKHFKEEFKINIGYLNPYIAYFGQTVGNKWISEERKDLYYWTRSAYFGGRTEIFDLNYLKDVYYYDANSLYPSVCIKNKLPNPKSFNTYDYPTIDFFKENFYKNCQYIIEAKVKENIQIPVLPIRKETVLFVNGTKKGVWAQPEFERFLEFEENEIIEIIKIKVYEHSDYYLKDFMQTRYTKRLQYIKEENDIQSFEEKQIMNALTGKFGQKPLRENWVLYNEDIHEELKIFGNKEIEIIEFSPKYKLIKVQKEVLKDFLLVDWILFITSFSRVEWHRTAYKVLEAEGKVYYCDTDCIFTNIPLEKVDKTLVGVNYAQWKNELESKMSKKEIKELRLKGEYAKIDQAKFYLPKVYAIKKNGNFDIKCKGISTFMIYESFNIELIKSKETSQQLYKILNSFEKIEKMLYLDGVSMKRYLKINSSLRQNKCLVSFGDISKKISKVYDKRVILDDLSTIPLNLDNKDELISITDKNLNTLLINNLTYNKVKSK